MNIEQANSIPMSAILASIGLKPEKEKPFEDWYLSPWRNEKTASFKVCKKTNKWYDHGEGVGGDVVNFACTNLKRQGADDTVPDALRWIGNMSGFRPSITTVHIPDHSKQDATLALKDIKDIQHPRLLAYLQSRGISFKTARRHLKELTVLNKESNKSFFCLGFKNEDDGYELRNPFFKGCIKPKTVSFIRCKEAPPRGIHIFEGVMDFLSVAESAAHHFLMDDVLILNSLSLMNTATAYIKNYGYKVAFTWLDNDNAGQKATSAFKEFFKTEDNLQHKPMNALYPSHKDVNAWHMHNLGL